MKDFDVYLFDFDGTLVDSHDSLKLVFDGAYSAVGVKVPEGYVLRLMRCSLQQGYKELNGPEDPEQFKIYASEIVRLLDVPEVLKLTKEYKETREVLTKLKNNGKLLGIVTSNSKKHVREVLHYIGLDENLFSVIVGNQETVKHKPNPDPILKGLELLGVSKNQACYVGDALDDVTSANNAEVTPILIDRRNEYSLVCEYQIRDLTGLLDN